MKFKTNRCVLASRAVVIGICALALANVFLFTTVSAGEVGVRYNNATGLLRQDLQPGMHVEVTGLQRIWRLPTRHLFIDYTDEEALSIRTKDNNTVTVDVSVPYRIVSGNAWKVMDAGNHLQSLDGTYRFQRFAEKTTTSVLREHLASLHSKEFYDTDRRIAVAAHTLKVLNKKLAPYHLQADAVLVRAAYFRPEYEQQLAQIQFNEQQKLLDGAKQSVADRKQALDNYEQQTNAMASAKEQDWARKLAQLDGAYHVGFLGLTSDPGPGAVREALDQLDETQRAALIEDAVSLLGLQQERVGDAHLLGIENIAAETQEYSQRVRAQAAATSARLLAEGAAKEARVTGAYEKQLNQLLDSPAGRAYVAYNAAAHVSFDRHLTFQSDDGIPSVLRLGHFARQFMGE